MYRLTYAIGILILLQYGCDERTSIRNEPARFIDSLEREIQLKGDTNAYEELRDASLEYPLNHQFFWAFMMANKYDYAQAHYDVYHCLKAFNNSDDYYSLSEMDAKTRRIALEYLRIAADRHVPGAKEELDSVLTKFPPLPKN